MRILTLSLATGLITLVSATLLAAPENPDIATRIQQRLEEHPADLGAHLDRQLLRFLDNQTATPADELESLDLEDREILVALVEGLRRFRQLVTGAQDMTIEEKMQPLLDMTDRLRDRANLRLPTLALCTSVSQFGVYEPIDNPRFTAGAEHGLIVYCEVENFHPHQLAGEVWETRLTYQAALYSSATPADPVLGKDPTPVIDRCRNRRRDFFVADRFTLPANLPAGSYTLKVTITDQQSRRIAENSIAIQIVNP